DPGHPREVNAMVVDQEAADEDCRCHRVELHADALAGEIFRRPDDSPVDRDMAMAEDARDEYGKRYKRAVALKVAADEIGNRHFGGFEFLCAAHAVEDFAWIVDSKKIEIDSVRFHIA